MSTSTELAQWTLERVAERCAQETDLYRSGRDGDWRHCYELFSRAIVDCCERAWELVYRQYMPLVQGWVRRHPAFPASGQEPADLANQAMARMWGAVGPDRLRRFPDLKSVLRYLQMCVHSVILDRVRARSRPDAVSLDDLAGTRAVSDPVDTETRVIDRLERQRLWDAVRERLRDDRELAVVFGSFVLGLKPRQLLEHYAGQFSDVREVYRIKENVLARLRRDTELRALVFQDA